MADSEDAPAAAAHEPGPAPQPPAPQTGKYDALIERWFAAAFHGSPHMRDTAAFNHVRAEVDELKTLLRDAP